MFFLLAVFGGSANAEKLEISDYLFVWHAVKVGDVKMDIEKGPEGLSIIMHSPGGPLAKVSATPDQIIAIAKVLQKSNDYYNKQMQKQDYKAEDMVPVMDDFKVYFTSSRGKDFQVSLRSAAAFSAAVLMTRDEALKMAEEMLKVKEMVALVNQHVRL